MVDVVLKPKQSRTECLGVLQDRILTTIPNLTEDDITTRMLYHFPESIETFSTIAQQQAWKNFHVLFNKGIFAFMVFDK